MSITDNLVYRDADGDPAYLNGDRPGSPYEPNPDYDNDATLGIIAQNDIVYDRSVPQNLELNASLLTLTGRVGIEGVVLDDDGEVTSFGDFRDEYGRPESGVTFMKNSIRRLGGVTTAKRPVESVFGPDGIDSGFNVGQTVFDTSLLSQPPPSYLKRDAPRFFPSQIVK